MLVGFYSAHVVGAGLVGESTVVSSIGKQLRAEQKNVELRAELQVAVLRAAERRAVEL